MFTAIAQNTTIHDFFDYHGKKYKYSVQNLGTDKDFDGADAYRLVCRGAKFSQDFLLEDVENAILSLETLLDMIYEERAEKVTHNYQIGLRISQEDKKNIEENAKKYKFSSVSDFLKTLWKNPEKFLQNH